MRRRSVSSLVSPGPRVPMPPPSCDMALPLPVSRGSMYSSCASSTCNCPRASGRAGQKCPESTASVQHAQGSAASRLRSCVGERSWSNRTRSALVDAATPAISSTLPAPISVAGSGRARRCMISAATWPPALSTSSRNSAIDSSASRPSRRLPGSKAGVRGKFSGRMKARPAGLQTSEMEEAPAAQRPARAVGARATQGPRHQDRRSDD